MASSTFTGPNNGAWTLDSGGAWSHSTVGAVFSIGPNETIQGNRGRCDGRVTTVGHRIHLAGTTTQRDVDVRVTFTRNVTGLEPGIILRSVGSTYYLAQVHTVSGKSATFGVSIYRVVGGVVTQLVADDSVSGLGVTADTFRLAFRATTLQNGLARLQAKVWNTAGAEVAWVTPAADTAGSSVTGTVDGSVAFVDDTPALRESAGQVGLLTEFATTAAICLVEYDDLTTTSTAAGPPVASSPGGPGGVSSSGAPSPGVASAGSISSLSSSGG